MLRDSGTKPYTQSYFKTAPKKKKKKRLLPVSWVDSPISLVILYSKEYQKVHIKC